MKARESIVYRSIRLADNYYVCWCCELRGVQDEVKDRSFK
jgi:hypothetical protein